MSLEQAIALDKRDPLADLRAEFELPPGVVYLDGNSLGALPACARQRAQEVVTWQWGRDLIGSWNQHGWIELPQRVGEKIAPLIGAAPGQVICCDSISVNLFKLLSFALSMQPGRNFVLSTQDNFPTDLYMVQGLSDLLGQHACALKTVNEAELVANLDESIAVLLMTQVNFRTGRLHDMQRLTRLAHEKGILVIWDLAHSAGALAVELDECEADFAVGCTYKYLNGGPGAPAFVYVARRHQDHGWQPLSGWMGHRQPFGFSSEYQPAEGMTRFLCGTPGILSMSVLDAALSVFADIDMQQVRAKSLSLGDCFIQWLQQKAELAQFELVTPLNHENRGSQVSLAHPRAYAICQALIAQQVIADFRAPDILRIGFTPLYTRFEDVYQCVARLSKIMHDGVYLQECYSHQHKVT